MRSNNRSTPLALTIGTPPPPPPHTDDLKTTACCAATVPKRLRRLLRDVHEDVLAKFYGCGSPLPDGLEGCTVLDLGCGSGRDCFVGTSVDGGWWTFAD